MMVCNLLAMELSPDGCQQIKTNDIQRITISNVVK